MTSLLQQQMTRYYDYMRPRHTNPTYSSFNVGTSLAVPTYAYQQVPPSRQYESSVNPKGQQTPVERYQEQSPKVQQPRQNMGQSRRSRSQLSQYGTNSLNKVAKHLNEKDIYQKQQKKYNIISIMPKEYNETIKKYPKFHLEHSDHNYYKKLQLQGEYDQFRSSKYQQQTH